MSRKRLAPDVWQIPLLPRQALNAYLIADEFGDVLVDAGLPSSLPRLRRALSDRDLSAHVLTHAHPDHQGASAEICRAWDAPLWCGAADRADAERGRFERHHVGLRRRFFEATALIGGPGQPVDRTLAEGDDVAGFTVVETPGHTPGHISLFREHDGVLILGDVASHRNPLSLGRGLREPARWITRDPERNRLSILKVAELEPRIVAFGHGTPLRDGDRFVRWARSLERS